MTYERPTDCSKNLKAWLHRTCTCGRENSKRSSSREGRHLGPRWPLIAPLFPWYACQASCWLLRARCSVFRLQERYRGGPLHLTSIRLRTQSLSWIGQRWCFFFFGAQRARMSRNAQRWRGETPLSRCFGWGISIRHETRSLPRGKTARENTYKVVCSVQVASVPTNCKQLAC